MGLWGYMFNSSYIRFICFTKRLLTMWLLVLLWVGLCLVFAGRGVEQGILWSKKGADAFTWNEHLVLGIVRVLTLAVIILAGVIGGAMGWWQVFVISAIFVPAFWFCHNTAYYLTRNSIDSDVYPNWFSAESTTSTSRFNMPFLWRVIGFGISVALLIIYTTLAV